MNNGVQVSRYKDKIVGYYGGKFLPFHRGHLNCIIKAASMVDVLFVVVSYDNDYDKSVCESTNFKWVESSTRERWITEAVRELRNIRVLTNYEPRKDNYVDDKDIRTANELLLQKIGGKLDFVFSSETEYNAYYSSYFPGVKHVVLDNERSELNISATKIREKGIYKMWDYLPRAVQKDYVKRVCICGIESTGKTFLTKQLAAMYDTNYATEYGREFYEEIGGCFDIMRYEDLIKIACGHNYLVEQKVKDSNKVLFIDTDNVYTQFFVKEEYGYFDMTIDSLIRSEVDEIDLYIYLNPSIPHELDGMRQVKTPEDKQRENDVLKDLYRYYGKNIVEIDSIKDIHEIKVVIDTLTK